jgi:hypothetical protein
MPRRPPSLERGTIAERLMRASISAVGLRLRARPRDPISTVLRQVEEQEERVAGTNPVDRLALDTEEVWHCFEMK